MKNIFDEVSFETSKITTKRYSTSFSLGILALDSSIRNPIYAIYGFVRVADEIVDSFDTLNKKQLLNNFKQQTFEAIKEKISTNLILNSFQHTVNKYHINEDLILQFFNSMEMDLTQTEYDKKKYETYILGSAEVVGLMCLQVFVNGNKKDYEALQHYAMKLGSAFQKINFLRDIKHDYEQLGRVYFPHLNINNATQQNKLEIENDLDKEFKEALIGIRLLPKTCRFGVYLAYQYYLTLFKKIKKYPFETLIKKRIRINQFTKIYLSIISFLKFKFNII